MPPPPIDGDIDLPVIRDKLLELLRLLWAFFSNIFIQLWSTISTACIVLWSYMVQGFEAVWTWPPLEAFRTELVAAVIALWDYVLAHPVTAGTIFVLAYIVVPCVYNTLSMFLLHGLGFRRQGVLRDSYAANYQSTSYGGNMPRGSTFARWQSQGAKGGGASSSRRN
ncbi:hypothetical protein JVU11DRAFT_3227 [Chiua virens]|nr:hypothetical protein JVU11DRAFT_3227 [Chiua virens]